MNTIKKLTVIIPHFNSPELLCKLLSSIPEREEIQILVVDDNSTVAIDKAKSFAQTRANVTWLVNDSGVKGAGAARNVGLRQAVGEWLLFADADDFFLEGMYDRVHTYFDQEYDMVYFPPVSILLPSGEVSHRTDRYAGLISAYQKDPSAKNEAELRYSFCTPWSKLIRRRIFTENSIFYDEIKVSNDVMAITKCAFYAKKIAVCPETIYCVTRQAKTLTSVTKESDLDIRIDALIRRYAFLQARLDKKDFQAAHIDRVALSRLVDCMTNHFGIRKVMQVLKQYRAHHIAFFDLGLLNPSALINSIRIQFSWSKEIKNPGKKS